MKDKKLAPIHPGEVLLEEFLKPLSLSQNRLALDMGVPVRRINEIVREKRAVTADTVLRFGRHFNMSAQFWRGMQMDYYLDDVEDAALRALMAGVGQWSRNRESSHAPALG